MKKLIFLTLLLLAIIMLTGCPDDPVRPDPCDGKSPFKADFTIYEQMGFHNMKFEADTVVRYNVVHFVANGEYDSYRWTVGTQLEEYTTKSFALSFDGVFSNIPVRLIATKRADSLCFPNDRTIDTVIKYVTSVIPADLERSYLPFVGTWRGSTDKDPLDTFDVELGYIVSRDNNGDLDRTFHFINNLNKGCQGVFHQVDGRKFAEVVLSTGYRTGRIASTTGVFGCNAPNGHFIMSKDHTEIIIEYKTIKNEIGEYVFKGRRVK
ncbi:MAG: hypothetical protein WCZ17_04460 [Candidatus Kapaibacterium sp.]